MLAGRKTLSHSPQISGGKFKILLSPTEMLAQIRPVVYNVMRMGQKQSNIQYYYHNYTVCLYTVLYTVYTYIIFHVSLSPHRWKLSVRGLEGVNWIKRSVPEVKELNGSCQVFPCWNMNRHAHAAAHTLHEYTNRLHTHKNKLCCWMWTYCSGILYKIKTIWAFSFTVVIQLIVVKMCVVQSEWWFAEKVTTLGKRKVHGNFIKA